MFDLPEMKIVEINCVDPDGELVTSNSVREKIVEGYSDDDPEIGEEWFVEVVERDEETTKLAPIYKITDDHEPLSFDPETDDQSELPEELRGELKKQLIGKKNHILNDSEL
jgi:hypothetical protein